MGSRNALIGHSYDRAGDWVYHCLLLLGSDSSHQTRRLIDFCCNVADRGEHRQAAGAIAERSPINKDIDTAGVAARSTDWVHNSRQRRAPLPGIVAMLQTRTPCRRRFPAI
jgi:hypothetical protein